MRISILGMTVATTLACGKPNDVGTHPDPDEATEATEATVPKAAATPPDAGPPGVAEHGRIAVRRVEGERPLECYDSFVAIRPAQRSPEASLPEVGARQLALLLLDHAVVSGSQGARDGARERVTELIRMYVTGVAPPDLSEEARASYAESARGVQAMTWPTETLKYEADSGALVETDGCAIDASPVAVCHVMAETPELVWSIQRAHFEAGAPSDSESGKEWCLGHGGDWTAGDPGAALERAKDHAQQLRDLVGD